MEPVHPVPGAIEVALATADRGVLDTRTADFHDDVHASQTESEHEEPKEPRSYSCQSSLNAPVGRVFCVVGRSAVAQHSETRQLIFRIECPRAIMHKYFVCFANASNSISFSAKGPRALAGGSE